MQAPDVGLLVVFSAGLLSFLSPCVLPLVPSYITFITGLSLEETQARRRTALIHGILFVVGFSLIFIFLGLGATLLGQTLFQYRDWISRIGGAVIIIFGLYLLGIIRIDALTRERRFHVTDKPAGYLGTMFVGFAFGAGWTPCIGPILGSVLIYASGNADTGRSIALLSAYSLGLAVPFVISAFAVDRFMAFFQRMKRQMMWLSRAAGAVMVAMGVLMITNRFTLLAAWLNRFTPDALLERL
ncbi:MAG: cytochrome c biogenesis CcdA family protein [Gemmatimonadota bacterium]